MKHTPGPWRTTPSSSGGLVVWRGPENSGHQSLQVYPEADAHLIAAAPDLLSALQYLYDEGPTKEAFALALVAFEKAEGRSL